MRARPVRGNQRVLVVLLLIGLIEAVTFLQRKGHDEAVMTLAMAGSLVLAALFGAVRAVTVRLWAQDGQPWMQGSLITALLWVLVLAAHLGYDFLIGQHKGTGDVGNATIVLYLVATLAVQRAVVYYRAQRLDPAAFGGLGPRAG